MSLRDEMNAEATNNDDPEGVAHSVWIGYGRNRCAEEASRKKMNCVFSLGGSLDFREAFKAEAEGDGFTVTPAILLLLTTEVTVSWA